ncbi:helix-turn-helix domain-containing protein [Adhaeribacter soli]|uniref:AraC family transcriptional regulator n=1 Tax=Adhaeribacter soli TaxID=2607655 RepID=A0A5N1J702_9BACT|nr:AraC family transcriptional regulator [Adhaeribacter soli]KAA9345742.1 AraC family transcriptional regulator [Adhaeribacter soli]
MLVPPSPLYSRMIEGKSSVALPVNSSHINHSTNTVFQRQNIHQGYCLKYVWSGQENYRINGSQHAVKTGQFLVVEHGSACGVEIKADKPVEGFCLYLNTELVRDVWTTLHRKPDHLPEGKDLIALPAFYQSVFQTGHHVLGEKIAQIAGYIKAGKLPAENLTEEIFYELASGLCGLQNEKLQQLSNIPARKKATREELYRRLLLVRDYVHDNAAAELTLAELAHLASLSEFHFLRTFKAVFGESPYRYLLRLRLQQAREQLLSNNLSVSEVAFHCGFKEVQAFSKIFRKMYGVSPSAFRQKLAI